MNKFLVLSLVTAGLGLSAQSIGNSPYAAFGLGDTKYDNSVDIKAMGGISAAYVSDFNNSYNFANPAANLNLELTSLRVQVTNENEFYKSNYNDISTTKHSNYLSAISLAFPISQSVKFGLGYQPYSSKKYDIVTTTDLADGMKQTNLFTGSGSVNLVEAAVTYKVNPSLGFGFKTNFYFGNVTDLQEVAFTDAPLINGYETKRKVKNFNFTLGSVYQHKTADDHKFTVGADYTFGNTGNLQSDYLNSTYYYGGLNTKANETIISQASANEKNIIPQQLSVGVGYGNDGKWFASLQGDYRTGQATDHLLQNYSLQDAYRISAGGWILPNYNNFRNYFERVIYRGGIFYEKGGLRVNNTDINQYGLTLGANFPFQKSNVARMSSIDVAVELGKRGTVNNNLVSEGFVNVKLGINFADKWFMKRYYN
ncbi:MAG: hypothetical protein EAS48_09320 [Chryseobacterium sp.]|nr:MAG: hypothetical protein EAS48_09320 [Chryseobacterium sp.]